MTRATAFIRATMSVGLAGMLAGSATGTPSGLPVLTQAAAAQTMNGQLTGTVKIVSSFPRVGAAKAVTDDIVNAIHMALGEVNYRVGDATISYEDLDDASVIKGGWDGATEAANANTALNDPDVMIYLGPLNSGAAAISIPILCPANLAMISPSATYPGLTKQLAAGTESVEPGIYYPSCSRNFTRVIPTDEIQGAVAAQWSNDLVATRVYLLDDTGLYGHGIATFYRMTADHIGLGVVAGPEGIDPRADDYRALAQRVRDSGADLVFFGGGADTSNAGKLWQDLRSTLDSTVRLMGPDGLYGQSFLDGAGSAAEGTFVTFGGVPASILGGRAADWYSNYTQQFGEPEAYAIYAYEATRVAVDAIQRAGRKDRAAVRDAVFATNDYDGVLGRWSFTDTGDTTLTTMSGRQVVNGKFDDAHAVALQAPQ